MKPLLALDIKFKAGEFKGHYNFRVSHKVSGIWGESGTGKTTLIKIISGLEKHCEGSIRLNGEVLTDTHRGINKKISERRIGVVFQDVKLFPHLSVEQNLRYGMSTTNPDEALFREVIQRLGIQRLLNTKSTQCSGGEQRRIGIARALLAKPGLLLLDEPFNGLDLSARKKTIQLLKQCIDNMDIPVMIVSHDMGDIIQFTDNILIVEKGKVKLQGRFHELLMQGMIPNIKELDWFVNELEIRTGNKTDNTHYQGFINGSDSEISLYSKQNIPHGERLYAFLKPKDIAIANKLVEEISIQNQLKTTIIDIYVDDKVALCSLSIGREVICQLTADSVQRLNLYPGKTVYALFKSVAINVFV